MVYENVCTAGPDHIFANWC